MPTSLAAVCQQGWLGYANKTGWGMPTSLVGVCQQPLLGNANSLCWGLPTILVAISQQAFTTERETPTLKRRMI
jgi:hypothetical protein